MKVFLLSGGYPTDRYKMNGIFVTDQALALAKAGLEVSLLALDLRSLRRLRRFGYRHFHLEGLSVHALDFPLGALKKKSFFALADHFLSYLYKKAVEAEGKPDLLHTYFIEQGYELARLAEKIQVPFVFTEPSSLINRPKIDPEIRQMAEFTYPRASRLITVSSAFRRKVQEEFGLDSQVIPILPNLDLFHLPEEPGEEAMVAGGPAGGQQGDQPKPFRIVSTSRLVRTKGIFELVQAFDLAFSKHPEVSLDLFGDGADRPALEKVIAGLSAGERIHLHGMTHRAQIAQAYGKSDLFALYSHAETFGLAYLEALAAGLPVVASRSGGPEDMIRPENGLLVDLDNVQALADALSYMVRNRAHYDRRQIASSILKEYSSTIITEKILGVYRSVLEEQSQR